MSTPLRLLGISGSLRTGAYSTAILMALAEAAGPRASFAFANIGALPLYNQDLEGDAAPAAVTDFEARIAAADGVVLMSAEFDPGMPGALKNALDWASRPAFRSPFKHKPMLIVTSSMAFTGGARAGRQLRETLASMLARPAFTPETVIGLVRDKVVNGRPLDRAPLASALNSFEALFEEIRVQTMRRSLPPHSAVVGS
jgi:chromate reductase